MTLNLVLDRSQRVMQLLLSQVQAGLHGTQRNGAAGSDLTLTHPLEEGQVNDLLLSLRQLSNDRVKKLRKILGVKLQIAPSFFPDQRIAYFAHQIVGRLSIGNFSS